jgi:hypothetical protein
MSDRQLGEDWWLASDGKWYPPQSRSVAPPPPSPTYSPGSRLGDNPGTASVHRRRYVSFGLTGSLAGFFFAAAGTSALIGILYISAWVSSRGDDFSRFFWTNEAWDAAASVNVFYMGAVQLPLVVLMIVWSNVAYNAALSRGGIDRKWSSGWAVGAWFIPFANLVIPKLVINEIDRMSHPSLSEPIGITWMNVPRLQISDWWWTLFLGGIAVGWISGWMVWFTFDGLAVAAVGSLVTAGAGFLGGLTVLKIGTRLRSTPETLYADSIG